MRFTLSLLSFVVYFLEFIPSQPIRTNIRKIREILPFMLIRLLDTLHNYSDLGL